MLADDMLKINPWAYVKKIHTRMTDTGDYITIAYLDEGGHVKGFGGSESAAIGMALTKIREYAGIE